MKFFHALAFLLLVSFVCSCQKHEATSTSHSYFYELTGVQIPATSKLKFHYIYPNPDLRVVEVWARIEDFSINSQAILDQLKITETSALAAKIYERPLPELSESWWDISLQKDLKFVGALAGGNLQPLITTVWRTDRVLYFNKVGIDGPNRPGAPALED